MIQFLKQANFKIKNIIVDKTIQKFYNPNKGTFGQIVFYQQSAIKIFSSRTFLQNHMIEFIIPFIFQKFQNIVHYSQENLSILFQQSFSGIITIQEKGICNLKQFFQKIKTGSEKQLDSSKIQTIIDHILNGIYELHSLKFAHRDIKPENIIYLPSRQMWCLTDFGVSSIYENIEDNYYILGTQGYFNNYLTNHILTQKKEAFCKKVKQNLLSNDLLALKKSFLNLKNENKNISLCLDVFKHLNSYKQLKLYCQQHQPKRFVFNFFKTSQQSLQDPYLVNELTEDIDSCNYRNKLSFYLQEKVDESLFACNKDYYLDQLLQQSKKVCFIFYFIRQKINLLNKSSDDKKILSEIRFLLLMAIEINSIQTLTFLDQIFNNDKLYLPLNEIDIFIFFFIILIDSSKEKNDLKVQIVNKIQKIITNPKFIEKQKNENNEVNVVNESNQNIEANKQKQQNKDIQAETKNLAIDIFLYYNEDKLKQYIDKIKKLVKLEKLEKHYIIQTSYPLIKIIKLFIGKQYFQNIQNYIQTVPLEKISIEELKSFINQISQFDNKLINQKYIWNFILPKILERQQKQSEEFDYLDIIGVDLIAIIYRIINQIYIPFEIQKFLIQNSYLPSLPI